MKHTKDIIIPFPMQRRFKGTEIWTDISPSEAAQALQGYYINMDLIVAALRDGREVQTSFAYYRKK